MKPSKNKILTSKFKIDIKKLGSEGIFIGILGISFVLIQLVLYYLIPDIILPSYYIYLWLGLTCISVLLIYTIQNLRKQHGQLLLFYFGIGIMVTTIYLQFINNFSDHFIFFYWTMAVSVSLGIVNFRLQLQIWALPLLMVLFATYYADISEADKLQFYIWNPIITIMSYFGVYSSVKTKNELKKYKKDT